MKKSTFLLFFLLTFSVGYSQLKLTSFEQIDSLQNIEKRKTIVFIHTYWCQYCHAMKSKTLQKPEVVKKLNDKFYFIDFNAEEKRKITFNKHQFQFQPNGTTSGIHELARQLGTINNKVTYPTLCILNENHEIIFQHSGFLTTKDLNLILNKIE